MSNVLPSSKKKASKQDIKDIDDTSIYTSLLFELNIKAQDAVREFSLHDIDDREGLERKRIEMHDTFTELYNTIAAFNEQIMIDDFDLAYLRNRAAQSEGEAKEQLEAALEELDDDLFVGGTEDELAGALVGEAKEDVAHDLVAAGCLPDLDGVDGGHHELLASGGVHLFADDAFDVVEGEPGEGEEGVDAGGDLVDEASAKEELVGGGVGLRGGLTEGLAEEPGVTHGEAMVTGGGQ